MVSIVSGLKSVMIVLVLVLVLVLVMRVMMSDSMFIMSLRESVGPWFIILD